MKTLMSRTALALGAVAGLSLLGGCAYEGHDGHYRGGYYGSYYGGYYDPDYYYGHNRVYIPHGGYRGAYHHDRDGHRGGWNRRDRDGDQDRNRDRGDNRNDSRGNDNRAAVNPSGNRDGGYDRSADRAQNPGNYLPNGDRITRGNAWQLNRSETRNAAPPPSAEPRANSNNGGWRGRGRNSDNN
ncbi:MAG TPA: hypothetical protein VJ750_04745 [Rhizomicrobium sp.]|nr:hypothetical protein [Rhizomicrobium sp.]